MSEHPSVLGARVGACVYTSFVFPALLWAAGAVTPSGALAIAIALTIVGSRAMLLVGGPRVGRVAFLQLVIAAALLLQTTSPWVAIPAAIFGPLLGLLCTVALGARVAELVLAEDESPYEAEAAVALAMQSNVVDIRSAEAARRASKKARGQSGSSSVTPSLQSQI